MNYAKFVLSENARQKLDQVRNNPAFVGWLEGRWPPAFKFYEKHLLVNHEVFFWYTEDYVSHCFALTYVQQTEGEDKVYQMTEESFQRHRRIFSDAWYEDWKELPPIYLKERCQSCFLSKTYALQKGEFYEYHEFAYEVIRY
ncbi:hypothetical protein [Moorena sp. SIO3A2]|uniref:hypothetical protein n=1 Tax=Moorena sp. SIO3A2 TaxID=2607841 RepID=UPI0013B89D90|nr:hypothetical protein [Moorena sp. SIO3A2]NER90327.1 hypothetical protein [Moorena sp. SIO3A2]